GSSSSPRSQLFKTRPATSARYAVPPESELRFSQRHTPAQTVCPLPPVPACPPRALPAQPRDAAPATRPSSRSCQSFEPPPPGSHSQDTRTRLPILLSPESSTGLASPRSISLAAFASLASSSPHPTQSPPLSPLLAPFRSASRDTRSH